MKKLIIVIFALVAALGGAFAFASSGDKDGQASQSGQSQQVSASKIPAGAVIYDVRTSEEFATGKVASSINWPVEDMQQGKIPDDAKDTPLYIYCRSGRRATEAKQILESAGFKSVTNMGGLEDVGDFGLSISKD